MTDSSKAKFIIGNMVIPVTDEIVAVLKGDCTTDNLVRCIRSNPERIMFLEGSLMITDGEGLDRWNELPHPSRITEDDIHELKKRILYLDDHLTDIDTIQRGVWQCVRRIEQLVQPKPFLFQRIFKRKKL